MRASPIIPGLLYRVRGSGIDCTVLAGHGCDAILIGLGLIGVAP